MLLTIPSPFLGIYDNSLAFEVNLFLVLSDLVGVDQLTIVIPTKVGIQLCLSGGSPPTRGWQPCKSTIFERLTLIPPNSAVSDLFLELKISRADRSIVFNSRRIKSLPLPLGEGLGERVNPPPRTPPDRRGENPSPVGFGGSWSINDCHSHEGGNPTLFKRWIPAYTGMTAL